MAKKKNNCNKENNYSKNKLFLLTSEEKKYLKLHKTLKLQIELVPKKSWYSNLRRNLKRSSWDKIRKHHYENANYCCEICGGKGNQHPVECHEVWEYKDKTLIQKLSHFQALCPSCHEVKHYGRACSYGNEERVFKRFKELNNLTDELSTSIIDAVFKQWQIRSRYKWNMDVEHLSQYGIDFKEFLSKGMKNTF